MDQPTIDTLETLLLDIRNFRESDDGTDQYPDETYLVQDVEARLDALLSSPWDLCSKCHRLKNDAQHDELCNWCSKCYRPKDAQHDELCN